MELKTVQALKIVSQLLVDHGLGDWHLDFKDVTSYHAQTYYNRKMITYSSRALMVMTKEQFLGITYHEIAHALVGTGHGHDRVFKNKYYTLAGDMDYAKSGLNLNTRHFLLTCPSCGSKGSKNNPDRWYYCKPCWVNKRDKQVMLITKNKLELVEWK